MPFDPNFPPTNARIQSLPFRNQFNSLNDDRAALAAQVADLQQQLAALINTVTAHKVRAG